MNGKDSSIKDTINTSRRRMFQTRPTINLTTDEGQFIVNYGLYNPSTLGYNNYIPKELNILVLGKANKTQSSSLKSTCVID